MTRPLPAPWVQKGCDNEAALADGMQAKFVKITFALNDETLETWSSQQNLNLKFRWVKYVGMFEIAREEDLLLAEVLTIS